jgi:hypothetical protein
MNEIWHNEPNGDLTAFLLGLKLVIHKARGFSRFLLFCRPHGGRKHEVLLESGCEDNVPAAQEKAVRRAVKLTATLAHDDKAD